MLEMDGYEAVRVLRAQNYVGSIIALTAHAMKEEKEKCADAGFNGCLSKPVDRSEFIDTIIRFAKR